MLFLTDSFDAPPPFEGVVWTVHHLHRPLPRPAFDAIIGWDIALDDRDSVERLRAALAARRADRDLAVVAFLRDDSPMSYALANAIGATRIVAPAKGEAIVFALPEKIHADVGSKAGMVDEAETSALVAGRAAIAVEAFAALFSAAMNREAVPLDRLDIGAAAVVSALKIGGVREWVDLVRRYDDATYQHSLLVAGLVTAFSIHLGLSASRQHLLSQAALLHDIGKARIPLAILNKPGKLSDAELLVMRKHPGTGYYMLAAQRNIDASILDIVRHHHEYLDGTGYPVGLRNLEVSENVRITTICDIFAALIEQRPYKRSMPPRESYNVLLELGGKLDAGLVADFAQVVGDLAPPVRDGRLVA